MRTKTHFTLRLLGLVTVLLIGTVTWTGCQGCMIQPGMSPEGWCCDNGNVAPCSEDECHSWGGVFFPTEHEAIMHCQGQTQGQILGEGWCCRGDEVFPCPEHECYDVGGDFFPTEHEAIAHCGGQMPPGEGWCCDAGNVVPCSEAECLGWGGAFFLHEHEAIAHCQGSAPGPSPPGTPVIHYFTANPSPITGGQSSTLKWDVSGANTVGLTAPGFKVLHPLGTTDQLQVSPTATKVYTLTATNSAGTVTDTATVTVTGSAPPGGLPVINYFTANPPSISPGQPVTLSWQVTNVVIPYAILLTAPGFTSAGKALVAVDQLQVFPTSTTTYTLAITKPAGTVTATATVTVTGAPPSAGLPVINYFNATPSTISAGQSTTLKWDVSGATQPIELVLNDPLHTVLSGLGYHGQKTDSPTATGVYTLRATNSAGTVTDIATVTVTP